MSKKTIVCLILLPLGLLFLVIGVTLHDQPLNPEITALLEHPLPVTPAAIAGYKYYLGFGAPEGEDPAAAGEKLYAYFAKGDAPPRGWDRWPVDADALQKKFSSTAIYLDRETLQGNRPLIDETLAKNKILIERLDHLVDLGAMGSDFRHRVFNGIPVSQLLVLNRLKLRQLNEQLHAGQTELAMTQLKKMFRFYQSCFQGHYTLLEASAFASTMKTVRRFVEEAKKDLPALQKALDRDDSRAAFVSNLNIADVVNTAMVAELEALRDLRISSAEFWRSFGRAVVYVTFLAPNRMLNAEYDCVRNGGAEPNLTLYPLSRSFVHIFCSSAEGHIKKLNMNMDILQTRPE